MIKHYITIFPDGTKIRWKPITWGDYHAVVSQFRNSEGWAADWLLCEAIAALCILDIEQNNKTTSIEDLYAGSIYVIGKTIIDACGFVPDPELINKQKQVHGSKIHQNWYEQVKSLIMYLFHIPESTINTWTMPEFMGYAARAEVVMQQPINVKTIDENDNEENTKVMYTEDGRVIPLITKKDITKKTNSLNEPQEIEIEQEGRRAPNKNARNLHPSKLRQLAGQEVRRGRR